MFRVNDDILVLLDDVDNMQLDTQLFRRPQGVIAFWPGAVLFTNSVGVSLDTKTGVKINALDMYTLVHHHARSQQ